MVKSDIYTRFLVKNPKNITSQTIQGLSFTRVLTFKINKNKVNQYHAVFTTIRIIKLINVLFAEQEPKREARSAESEQRNSYQPNISSVKIYFRKNTL